MTKRSSPKPKPKKSITQKRVSPNLRNWIAEGNTILEKHKLIVIGALFFLSLVLSAVYYLQSRDTPIMTYYKWENSDMAFFHTWATKIAAGDWWGDEVLHPYHSWHDDLAAEYFKQYPDIAAEYHYVANDTSGVKAKKALINDIYKGKVFHQEPLYTYMVAITYAIFGVDPVWVYFWQFLLSAFTSVLVFLITRHFFGALTGLIAALFVTLCGSIMVYEMVLLRTTISNFFTVVLLYLFIRSLEKKNWKDLVLFGAASGFALLSQSYFLLFIFPAVLWLLWSQRENRKIAFANAVSYITALLIVMSPLFIRNIRAGVPITAAASHGAMAYIPMNIENSYPMESFYVHMPSLVKIRHDSEGKLISAAMQSLKTFKNFGSFFNLYKQKIGGMFMWYEIPNNMNYYLYREIAPVLKAVPVKYFFIAPLGLAGLLLGLYRYRWRIMPLLLMTVVSIIPILIAGNLARYRTPLVIMMAVFAAYFIVELYNLYYERKLKTAFASIALAILAFIYTTGAEDKYQFIYYPSDFDTFYRYFYLDKLIKAETEGNEQEYLRLTTHMVENIPGYFLNVPANQPIRKGNEASSSQYVANFLETHVNILDLVNKKQEAAFYRDRVNILRARIEEFNRKVGRQ